MRFNSPAVEGLVHLLKTEPWVVRFHDKRIFTISHKDTRIGLWVANGIPFLEVRHHLSQNDAAEGWVANNGDLVRTNLIEKIVIWHAYSKYIKKPYLTGRLKAKPETPKSTLANTIFRHLASKNEVD